TEGLPGRTCANSGANCTTSNGYDVLDNLKMVTQGSQSRSFTYDSRRLLLSATNPESGMTSYAYDANRNRVWRSNSAGVETCYHPDVLNRTTLQVYYTGSV